jgi:hypothetical protein
MLKGTARTAGLSEKARMELTGEKERFPKDRPALKSAAQAKALETNLRKKFPGQTVTITTVDIPKESPRGKPGVAYYVDVYKSKTLGEAALEKITTPGKGDKPVKIVISTPNGDVTLEASTKDAAAIAKAMGGKIEEAPKEAPLSKRGTEALKAITGKETVGAEKIDMSAINRLYEGKYEIKRPSEAEMPSENIDSLIQEALKGKTERAGKLQKLDEVMM